MTSKAWRTYEEVAQYLLEQFAKHFGLGKVEGKQLVPGASGTSWEIDAKGITSDGGGIVLVECRRYTKSKLTQEQIGGVAFRVIDTGAKGGITVSPLDLQKGAHLVAAHANIVHIVLDPKSTTTEYVMKFLDKIFVGFQSVVKPTGDLGMNVIRGGNVVETRNAKD